MKKTYLGDYRLSGDRIVEIPWIRDKLRDVKEKLIADYGCIIRNASGSRLGWWSYGIHISNSVTGFDLDNCPELNYIKINILEETLVIKPAFDIGVCVSAMEHFGLGKYVGNPMMPDGDAVGLRAMMESIKPGGKMYITVPCGRGIILNEWIREYSPDQLRPLLGEHGKYKIDYFLYENGYWYEVDADTLVLEKIKEPETQTVITGLSCIEILKGA